MKKAIAKLFSAFLVFTMAAWTIPPQAFAGMIGTERSVAAQSAPFDRSALHAMLERDDVQRQLVALGVEPRDAHARVAALTDEQARDMAARIDEMPAGGIDVLGALFTVAIILLVTDLLGFTRVYPFMRTAR
jgi:hypothetical protein